MSQRQPVDTKSFVLLVDDNSSQIKTIADILETEDMQPICCSTGGEALEACRQYDVHVAVLDLRLADMDGLEVLKALKAMDPEMKVIIHTAFATLDSAIGAINEGAFAYVKKLARVEELLGHIHRAIHALDRVSRRARMGSSPAHCGVGMRQPESEGGDSRAQVS